MVSVLAIFILLNRSILCLLILNYIFFTQECLCMWKNVYIIMVIYIYAYILIYVYVCMYTYTYIYTYVCLCIYEYIHSRIWPWSPDVTFPPQCCTDTAAAASCRASMCSKARSLPLCCHVKTVLTNLKIVSFLPAFLALWNLRSLGEIHLFFSLIIWSKLTCRCFINSRSCVNVNCEHLIGSSISHTVLTQLRYRKEKCSVPISQLFVFVSYNLIFWLLIQNVCNM